MRTLTLLTAVALLVAAGTQERKGYFEKLLDLHDLENDGPKAASQILRYPAFADTGAICKVKLGISMSEAVEAWGKPRKIFYTGNGYYWYLNYGRGCSLGFSNNRLVSISVTALNLQDSRFDNGVHWAMTRAEVIALLGEPFHRSHAGISYKVGHGRVVDFTFQIERQFPKNAEEWNTAKLWSISINGTEWVNNGMQADPRTSGR